MAPGQSGAGREPDLPEGICHSTGECGHGLEQPAHGPGLGRVPAGPPVCVPRGRRPVRRVRPPARPRGGNERLIGADGADPRHEYDSTDADPVRRVCPAGWVTPTPATGGTVGDIRDARPHRTSASIAAVTTPGGRQTNQAYSSLRPASGRPAGDRGRPTDALGSRRPPRGVGRSHGDVSICGRCGEQVDARRSGESVDPPGRIRSQPFGPRRVPGGGTAVGHLGSSDPSRPKPPSQPAGRRHRPAHRAVGVASIAAFAGSHETSPPDRVYIMYIVDQRLNIIEERGRVCLAKPSRRNWPT